RREIACNTPRDAKLPAIHLETRNFASLHLFFEHVCDSNENRYKNAKQPLAENTTLVTSVPTNEDKAIPKYDRIFVIIEENKSYDQIIGNPSAPIINQLAKTYNLAANFHAQVHPSEANYIAMLGGDTFGIHDDDAFYCQAGSSDQFCHKESQI
ncbi:alkaline phosphatase family protein, partial [Plectonema radiosum NIES-515]|nr:alkaline phosphatase family protein [Plectonema radiosum NIES-515]